MGPPNLFPHPPMMIIANSAINDQPEINTVNAELKISPANVIRLEV